MKIAKHPISCCGYAYCMHMTDDVSHAWVVFQYNAQASKAAVVAERSFQIRLDVRETPLWSPENSKDAFEQHQTLLNPQQGDKQSCVVSSGPFDTH